MKCTLARVVAAGAALLAVSAGGMAAHATAARAAIAGPAGSSRHVVFIGIAGLRWSDMSAAATPVLWRLAGAGSAGSLAVTTIDARTCPVDAWLTLNAGARAAGRHAATGPCPALPAVVPERGRAAGAGRAGAAGTVQQARVPALPRLVADNRQFNYDPQWGLLGCPARYLTSRIRCSIPAGQGQCSTAIGPGAAIALANAQGEVASYLPGADAASRSEFDRCALTVVDLGALPGGSGSAARARAVHAADLDAGRIIAEIPAGAVVVVAGMGDSTAPHLRAMVVSGPGFRRGLLVAPSTRQPGMVVIADLTRSVLGWLGRPAPSGVVGSQISSMRRGVLSATVRTLIGQDTAAQVHRSTITRFFVGYWLAEGVLFGLITLMLHGSDKDRRRRRAAYMAAGVLAGAVPAGSFLASVVPWPQLPHPALLLYALTVGWAAVIAAAALAGPWRRDPFGPPGFVGAVTVAVIGLDVITGSRLQLGGPFGLSALQAGRFYGVGNDVLGVYAAAGILCAAWAGLATLGRDGSRRRGVAAAVAVALFTVIASGWPGFGAKVGGTIAMVPGFLLLLAALAGLRITIRRGALIGASGLLVVTAFALINYFLPATGPSDIGGFVGHALHGGAGSILQRKITSNARSLTQTWYTPAVPVAAVVTGLMIAWPGRLRLTALTEAFGRAWLLRPALTAIWLAEVLGCLADDYGVIVAAIGLPFVLPQVVAMVSGLAAGDGDVTPEPAIAGPGRARTGAG